MSPCGTLVEITICGDIYSSIGIVAELNSQKQHNSQYNLLYSFNRKKINPQNKPP